MTLSQHNRGPMGIEREREEREDVALEAQISHINIYSEAPVSPRNRIMKEHTVGNG